MIRSLVVFTSSLLAIAGCSSTPEPAKPGEGWQKASAGVAGAQSGSSLERYFPLVDGTLYHYKVESLGDTPGGGGMLMMRVHRSSASQGELRKPTGTQAFELLPDAIATTTKTGAPAFLLKAPIEGKGSWLGPHGGVTRVAEPAASITTQAGTFNGCVVTVEERGGDKPLKVTTTLCPDVGIARLQVEAGGGVERAELVYFGPPVEIGPDGLTREGP